MDAVGLGKDLEFTTPSRAQCELSSLMGKVWWAQGTKGKPVERNEEWRKETVAEGEGRLPHTLAGYFSFISGCKLKYLQVTIFDGGEAGP